ncbi:lasso peptide biosynthesis B2 protein [Novosphingobium sp. CCH12-A3]|uniref:lasso peptide biosynthesis B2 protein n=1 Tax=Novosphingobium sp. CCH12-A3 TaxID=1768752 RepID=UPI000785DF06|nr:lasso peptide biosynthesis B2 protein [Novosphingobium sp. CCH12-A3]
MTSLPPAPQVRLADGIGLARFANFVILLDVPCDRYTRFGGNAAVTLAAIADGRALGRDVEGVAALERAGIVTAEPQLSSYFLNPREVPQATSSVLEGGESPPELNWHDLEIVFACAKSRLDLRRKSLAQVLRHVPAPAPRRRTGDIGKLARDFDAGRRLAPFAPCCLPDALAFTRYARQRGHDVRLVFGVKCHPFEAHCWAQLDSVVLTDPLERIVRFQPILAL